MRFLKLLLTLCILTQTAFAINLQSYQFSDSYRFAILDDSLILKHSGDWVATASVAYINTPLVVSDQDAETVIRDFVDNFWVGTLGFSYYFSKKFSLGGNLNFMSTSYSDQIADQTYLYANNAGETKTGLADTMIKANWRFYTDLKNRFAISLTPKVYLPTGSEEAFSGDDSLRGTLLLVAEKFWTKFSIQGAIGYSTAGSGAAFYQVDYRELIPTQLGVSYRLTNKWNINGEFMRDFSLKGSGNSKQDSGDYYLTAKTRATKTLAVYFGGGIAGLNDVDQENWTLFAGVKFSPEAKAKVVERPAPVPQPTPEPIAEPIPEPIAQAPQTRAEEASLGVLFKADRVYFANSSAALDARSISVLDEVAAHLLANKDKVSKVVIEGYASKVGPKQFNQTLSDTRAKTVLRYLADKGVNPELLSTVAYGDDYQNEEPEHWQNRRVDFRIYNVQE
jgi:outer membrane protein OmpA-like peptidoglycan-associated protein